MQSVARSTKGSSALSFVRTDSCVDAAEPGGGGVWLSSETFNTSDNPNRDSTIIVGPANQFVSLVSQAESRRSRIFNASEQETNCVFETWKQRRDAKLH
jgi:hypothetical protein